MSKIHTYTVVSTQMVGDTLIILLRNASNAPPMRYKPGQYAAISFIRHNRPTPVRCFSLTSSPTDEELLRFGTKVKGNYTKAATEALTPGSTVIVEGPFGHFTFDQNRDTSTVMLAGGIGVTPYISMLRYAAQMQLPNDITMLYSCHTQDDIPFFDELMYLQQNNPNFKLLFVIGSGPVDRLQAAGAQVATGRINSDLLDKVTGKRYLWRTFFICGPPPFMSGVRTTLLSCGVPEPDIITEAFTQGQSGPRAVLRNFPLQVYVMTGFSILLGSVTVLMSSVAAALPHTGSGQSATTGSTTSNSPQDNTPVYRADPNDVAAINSLLNAAAQAQQQQDDDNDGDGLGGTQPSDNDTDDTPPPSSSPTSSSSDSSSPTPTPTPEPSPSPSPSPAPAPDPVPPTLSFYASKTSITSGQSTVLTWSINSDATSPVSCTASGGWSGSKSSSGSKTVSPTSTTTYYLECSNSAGSDSQSITINVQAACKSTRSHPC